jgi:hypothetical protein
MKFFPMVRRLMGISLVFAIGSVACATNTDDSQDDEFTPTSTEDPDVKGGEAVAQTGEAVSIGTCSNICGGVGVIACSPFGGVAGSIACGFAGEGICIFACQHREPVRISEEKGRRCLLQQLPGGSSARFVGYKDTFILYSLTVNGRTGGGAVSKTYAGTPGIVVSWNVAGVTTRGPHMTSCPL